MSDAEWLKPQLRPLAQQGPDVTDEFLSFGPRGESEYEGVSTARMEDARQDFDRGGFPRAVWTDIGQTFALIDLKRDAPNRIDVPPRTVTGTRNVLLSFVRAMAAIHHRMQRSLSPLSPRRQRDLIHACGRAKRWAVSSRAGSRWSTS
jgi:hypothetical protein